MKICINEITKQGLDLEQELDPMTLDIETPQAHYPSVIKVKAHLEKEKDTVYARVFIKTATIKYCSRCLEKYDSVFEKNSDFIFKPEREHFIDLSGDIKDAVMLESPIKHLCKADCKGLCQGCGANLNKGVCSC